MERVSRRQMVASVVAVGVSGAIAAHLAPALAGPISRLPAQARTSLFIHDGRQALSTAAVHAYRAQGFQILDTRTTPFDKAWSGAIARTLADGGFVVGLTPWVACFAFQAAAQDRHLTWRALPGARAERLVRWTVRARA